MMYPVGSSDGQGGMLQKFSENTRLQIAMLSVGGILILAGILLSTYTKAPLSMLGTVSFSIGIPILTIGVIGLIYSRCVKGSNGPEPYKKSGPKLDKSAISFRDEESSTKGKANKGGFKEIVASLELDLTTLPEVKGIKDAEQLKKSDFTSNLIVKGYDQKNAMFLGFLIKGSVSILKKEARSNEISYYTNGKSKKWDNAELNKIKEHIQQNSTS